LNQIAIELDEKLRALDGRQADELAEVVRRGIAWYEAKRDASRQRGVAIGYPVGYFDELEGVFADEPFEREPQGELQERDDW